MKRQGERKRERERERKRRGERIKRSSLNWSKLEKGVRVGEVVTVYNKKALGSPPPLSQP